MRGSERRNSHLTPTAELLYIYILLYIFKLSFLYYCADPRVGRPRARSKDVLFPWWPSAAAQGQGTAASLELDIVTNLSLEVPPGIIVLFSRPHSCSMLASFEVISVLNVNTWHVQCS